MTKKILLTTALTLSGLMAGVSAQATDFYAGQIITTAAQFCPQGTIGLDGQLLRIEDNDILFSLLGTTYGGDGRTTFAVPDMRGRSPVHVGNGPGLSSIYSGISGGREYIVLANADLPSHSHQQKAHDHQTPSHTHYANMVTHAGIGNTNTLVDGSLATYPTGSNVYASGAPHGGHTAPGVIKIDVHAGSATSQNTGGPTGVTGNSGPIAIRSPYLSLRMCMVSDGIYPSQP